MWPALPDALTAASFAAVWASPSVFDALSVKTAMLVEFFLVHSTGFFTAFANMLGTSRTQRVLSVLGLSLFYLMMIAVFAWSFGEWWPLAAFGWLLVGKLWWVRSNLVADGDAMPWKMGAWADSVAAYLFGCALTAIADIPRWGMAAALQPQLGLGSSGGLCLDEPHRVVAFGVVYFLLLAAGKVLVAMLAEKTRA